MNNQTRRIDFSWRYQTKVNTGDARLLSYLKNDEVIPLREKMLQALRAFWLPLAYQHQDGEETSTLERERIVIEAIYALEKHADYLRSQFGLPPQPKSKSKPIIRQIVPSFKSKTPRLAQEIDAESEGEFDDSIF
ncbi:MAG TPA: hypothetical protein DD379_20820 [Cyanobacteria bacterium UBA11162]|nr:hypothetical protein [Cyanobacteria bacterium UBA11162]